MTVLVVTRSGISVQSVAAGLVRRGHRVVVVEADGVPRTTALSWHGGGRLTIRQDGAAPIRISDLHAVWYRRMAVRPDLPEGAPPELKKAVAAELRAFLRGILVASPVPVFQPKWHMDAADLRPRQLSVARAAGLDTPRTITTTRLSEAQDFVASCGGRAVTKMITGVVLPEPGEPPQVMMTTPVSADTLAEMDPAELRLCPATFQEHLDKRAEYRVTIVGERLFVAALPSLEGTRAETDWRRDGRGVLHRWRPAALPEAVQAGLLRLMDRLQLDYGAADVVETTDGRFVFLEVNPAGEYLWLEPLLGDAVSEALADLLSGQVPSRLYGDWA